MNELTRREALRIAGSTGVTAMIAAALPVALTTPSPARAAEPALTDALLQAFADTMIPGRWAATTESGAAIHPLAIAGADSAPGAVETDALALFHHPEIGFDVLEPAFIAELETQALVHGGEFLHLDFDRRVATCTAGLSFDNPARLIWEAAAAVPFTAFCAAALVRDATAKDALGYAVMGLPGVAPDGYRDFSYGRKLSRELTDGGSLP
jgi:hypothetical protein